jgi:alpha-D-xyloside xylohydrolase
MQLIRHTVHADKVTLETSSGFLQLIPYTDRIIRIRYAATSDFSTTESLMILPDVQQSVVFHVSESPESLSFSIPQLTIQINRATTAFTYLNAAGEVLTKEPDRGGKSLIPTNVMKTLFDESVTAKSRQETDGVIMDVSEYKQVFDRHAYHTKLEFEWIDDEAIYGLGSHEEGMMNLRGQHQFLYQQNMKAVVPILVSTHGYGIVRDSYSLMTFHDDAFGSYWWTDVDEELDYYFIYGPEFDQIVHQIRHLTGKVPMLPKWAFGYIQSKERYESQAELIAVVNEYRERGLPLDCIVLDWKSWPAGLWGQKSFDHERFPDPNAMTSDLHDLNARLMISIWPIMNPGGENWKEMRDCGYLLANQGTYDAFREEARALYWDQANKGLFFSGLDAWWTDCTEPFQADWHGAYKPEPVERLLMNTKEAKRYLDPQYICAYSLLHSKGLYDGQRNTTEDKRVVNLTRSAYGGQHRYATITWSGDVAANWETLRNQIPAGLNFTVTGSPYWTLDIGGFFVKNKPELWFWDGHYNDGVADLGFRELYVRWFQYAVFLPMFRAHGTDTPREIWRFGNPEEQVYDAMVKFLNLRYRLIPYIYSLAGRTTLEDYTMLRALPFDFRHDTATYDIEDQFMFGPAFLVNPVTNPMYYGPESALIEGAAKTRSVYLPNGADWYDLWTGKQYSGGQTIVADAGLETMPLYVRSGSIVPVGPTIQYTDEKPNSPLELRIYPGQDATFTLYDDEGDNYNYENGQYATIRLMWHDAAKQLIIEACEGSYLRMLNARQFCIVIAADKPFDPLNDDMSGTHQVDYTGQRMVVECQPMFVNQVR